MQISDVIADMLTRIRNANDAKHATVDVPASVTRSLKSSTMKQAPPIRLRLWSAATRVWRS